MHAKNLWVIATVAATVAAAIAVLGPISEAEAKGPEVYPLSKVRRGQKGYGITTMKGTTPERFTFEVIGVNHNFLPKMDIILVKSDDPKLKITGFWQGMSGSPLFIEGKVVCAFSYGFRFNKLAIGGCTPLQYMKTEGFKRPRRMRLETTPRGARRVRQSHLRHMVVPTQVATLREWRKIAPTGTVSSALATARKPWLMQSLLHRASPLSARQQATPGEVGMVAASVPLSMSGFSAPAFSEAKKIMARYALTPMRAGGTGNANAGPTKFQMGGSIAVQLLRGDMSAAATGTVSYVDGNRVLGFGHPMFQAGEIYAPVAAARIHTVIPSASSAFIVASPLRELGALVQDRQSTIMADTNLKTRMVPIDIEIRVGNKGAERHEFHVEVLNNRFFTGTLAGMVAMNAMSRYLPDRDHVTVLVDSTVTLRGGYKPLHFTDYLHSGRGAARVVGGARGLRVLVPLINNPYKPVEIERVRLKMRVVHDTNYGTIKSLRLSGSELIPGKRNWVNVIIARYKGADIVQRVPFDVPASLEGSIVRLEVTSGDSAGLDAAPPKNFRQMLAAFRSLLPGNVIAVTLYTAQEGIAIDGKLVRDLPHSALDKFYPSSQTRKAQVYRNRSRSTFPSTRVINGRSRLIVKVADANK